MEIKHLLKSQSNQVFEQLKRAGFEPSDFDAHKLDPELVESRLKYLTESSERLGRKDWLNLLLSVLVSMVISAALPPDATRELFRFVGAALRQILNGPLLLV